VCYGKTKPSHARTIRKGDGRSPAAFCSVLLLLALMKAFIACCSGVIVLALVPSYAAHRHRGYLPLAAGRRYGGGNAVLRGMAAARPAWRTRLLRLLSRPSPGAAPGVPSAIATSSLAEDGFLAGVTLRLAAEERWAAAMPSLPERGAAR